MRHHLEVVVPGKCVGFAPEHAGGVSHALTALDADINLLGVAHRGRDFGFAGGLLVLLTRHVVGDGLCGLAVLLGEGVGHIVVAEAFAHVVGRAVIGRQLGYGELHLAGSAALAGVIAGIEGRDTQRGSELTAGGQGDGVLVAVGVSIFILHFPGAARQVGRVVVVDVGREVVFVVIPLVQGVGLVGGGNLTTACEPSVSACMRDVGLDSSRGGAVLVTGTGELQIDEVVGLTAADDLDIAALAVGVRQVEVAQQHLEVHVVFVGSGMEITVVTRPVAGLHHLRQQPRKERHKHDCQFRFSIHSHYLFSYQSASSALTSVGLYLMVPSLLL